MPARPGKDLREVIGEGLDRRLRRTIDFLASGRLTVVLLGLVVSLLLVYLLVPQRGQVPEDMLLEWIADVGWIGRISYALGLTDVLHAWPFWALYGLLSVNLAVCMIRRTGLVLRLSRFPERTPRPSAGWIQREVPANGLRAEQAAGWLRGKGYRVLAEEGTVYGLRGRLGSVGHWVFHAGLLSLLIAGAFMALERDPFRARIGVGEGEPFDLRSGRLVSANQALPPDLSPLRFTVDQVELELEDGVLERFEVTLSTTDEKRADAGINRPYRVGPYQVLVHGFGYMPGWTIVNPRGRALGGAWVKLAPFPLEMEDSFPLGFRGSDEGAVHVRFYPDHAGRDGDDRSLSQELRNPRFRVRVVWRDREVFAGLVQPGERIKLEGGREFFFLPQIRRYALLDVIEERGHGIVFASLGAMVLGLMLRYARMRKQILVDVGESSLRVYGQAELLESLFEEELDRLVGELAEPPPENRRGEA